MKKTILTALYILGLVACLVYGLILGNATHVTTYESDLELCTNTCKSNEGIERVSTSASCYCENGAYFSGRDLR